MKKRIATVHALLVTALLATACQTDGTGTTSSSETAGRAPGMVEQAETNAFVDRGLAAKNPLDVAVLPIQQPQGRRDVPIDTLRRSFAEGLVKLRYSPLSTEFVDERTVEAGYSPGSLSESAALEVVISYWDDTQWRTRGRIDVRAEVRMLDSAKPAGPALWGGPIQTTLLINTRGMRPTQNMLEEACGQFVERVLGHLPPRRPDQAVP